MNPNATSSRTLAFTLVEMLMVIAIIGILAAMLLPVLNKSESRTKRVVCINCQEQIGLAFHTFSGDHNGKFPLAISTNDGGSLEFVQSGFQSGPVFYTAFRHFQTLASDLVRPQILICPSDTTRGSATNFDTLQNENLSYFVGVKSTFDRPYTILAGDRNLITNAFEQPTIIQLGPRSRLAWNWEVHQFKGNVLYADGHVEQWNDAAMAQAGGASPFNQSFFLPSVVPSEVPLANGSPGSSGPPGSSGSRSGGSADSGSAPSNPSGADSGQSAASSSGTPNMNTASSSSQGDMSAAGQSMPSMANSYRESLYATETLSQAESTDHILPARSVVQPPGAGTDEVISVQDPNVRMSPFDQHMTIVLRNNFGWLYLLLCILVLLYLLNKLRKRLQAKRRSQVDE